MRTFNFAPALNQAPSRELLPGSKITSKAAILRKTLGGVIEAQVAAIMRQIGLNS
jgi:hypothetical protein